MTTAISRATELLLCCARTRITRATEEKIEALLQGEIDWQYLRRVAKKNRVVPLVFHGLRAHCADAVPADVDNALSKMARFSADYNQNNLAVLIENLRLFKEVEIPVVPLKGVTFALGVYGGLSLRWVGDIDLLVRPENYLDAKNMLIRHGHRQATFGDVESAAAQAPLARDDGNPGVDLHYELAPLGQHAKRSSAKLERENWNRLDTSSTNWFFSLDSEPIWGRLDSLKVDGVDIPVLSPEDLLMVAFIHGIKENWRCLNRLCDIAELVRAKPEIDWERVLGEWRGLGCEKKFFLGLRLAHQLLDMPLPEHVSRQVLSSAVVTSLAESTRQQLCRDKNLRAEIEEFRLVSAFLTMGSWRDRLRYLLYIRRRLSEFSYRPKQYLSFAWRLIRQMGDVVAHAVGVAGRD